MSVIDTPDNQLASVVPTLQLAHVAHPGTTVTVTLPANTVSLSVLQPYQIAPPSVTVTGTTTGAEYPGVVVQPYGLVANIAQQTVFDVAPTVDATVTVTLSGAPTVDWWVFSSTLSPVVADPLLRSIIHFSGDTTPDAGLLIAGETSSAGGVFVLRCDASGHLIVVPGFDGANTHQLQTDTNGRAIPLVPTASSGPVKLLNASTAILAAPSSGANYLFGATLKDETGVAGQIDVTAGGVNIGRTYLNAPSPWSMQFYGYRTTGAVAGIAASNDCDIVLLYAPGP